jgi:DNA repair exonuclease SbcCD ATPase subunit/HAMP domain-containing protein
MLNCRSNCASGSVSENQVIARQEQYLNKLEKAKADLQKEIDSKGPSAERTEQMKILNDEISATQSSINELKQTLAAKSDGGTDVAYSSQQKAELLNKVDKNYVADNAKLQEQLRSGTVSENQVIARQEQYLNKLEKAKADLQKEIDSKGPSAERTEQMKILNDEISATQSSINELKQTLAAKSDGGTDVAYSSQQKAELLNKVDKNYVADNAKLQEQLRSGTVSENQVIARQEQYLNKLEKAKADLQKEIDSKGASAERTQQMKILDDEIAVTQSSINELKQTLAAKSDGGTDVAYSPQQKAEFLNKVDKNYAADNAKLQEQLRNGTVSENQVIALQEQYLNKLEKAKADLLKEIDSKGPSAERTEQLKILNEEIAATQGSINELKQTLAAKSDGGTDVAFSELQKETYLNKVDRKTRIEIDDLIQTMRLNESTTEAELSKLNTLLGNYQAALEKEKNALQREIERKGLTEERSMQMAILNQEINSISTALQNPADYLAAKGVIFGSGKPTEIQSIGDIATSLNLTSQEKNLVESNPRTQPLLEQKLELLERMESSLQNQLSTASASNEKAALEKQLATVRKEIRQVRIDIGDLEQGNIASIVPKSVTDDLTDKEKENLTRQLDQIENSNERIQVLTEQRDNAVYGEREDANRSANSERASQARSNSIECFNFNNRNCR